MAEPIKAIIGLGNPGPEYALTRHNAGALWLEYLCSRHGQSLKPEKKFHGHYCKLLLPTGDVHLLFPTTFMNRSGMAVAALSRFYKLEPENVLVAYDELDLEPGILRLKMGGGHGGHNGLRDIIKAFGNNKNFPRLRFGIGHPGDKSKVVNYVLGQFSKTDRSLLDSLFGDIDPYLNDILKGDWSPVMNHLHRAKS